MGSIRAMHLHRCCVLMIAVLLIGATGAAAEDPLYGGRVSGFIAAPPGSFDPHTASITSGQQAIAGVYSGLLQYDPRQPRDVKPDLAERWDAADGGKAYTFHLRRDAQWHDGAAFTAADVLATLTRLLTLNPRQAPCGSWLQAMIERVTAPDDYTVRIELTYPAAAFLATLASPWCRVVARHVLERDPTLSRIESAIGTGPFMIKSDAPNRGIVWSRNPNYYDTLRPYANEIVHAIVSHRVQWQRAASFGDTWFWSTWAPMSYAQAQELQRARGGEIEVYQWPLNTVWTLYLNPKRGPFRAPEMRRAVHLALDRQRLMRDAFGQGGTPCAILPPGIYGDWALPLEDVMATPGCRQPNTQDVTEAQRLVASIYPNGVDIDILVRSVGDYLARAQLIVPQLRRIGIRAQLKAYESSAAWRDYGRGRFDLIGIEDTLVMRPDPSAPFDLLFAADAPYNWSGWKDQTVENLAQRGLRAQEPDERRQIYHELQRRLLVSDSPTVVIGWLDGWYFRDKRLHGYQPSSIGYGNNGWANVWIGPAETAAQTAAAPPEQPDTAAGAIALPQALAADPPMPALPTSSAEAAEPASAVAAEPAGPVSKAVPAAAAPDASQEIVMRNVTRFFERVFPNGGAFRLSMKANKKQSATYTEGETLSVQVVSDRDAFLQVDYYQVNGDVLHLLPNLVKSHRLKAGDIFTLGGPQDIMQFTIAPPFGLELLTVIASPEPLDTQGQAPASESADAYIERLDKRFGSQPSETHAAVYLPIRTRPGPGK